jgi:aminomethyltransferase
VSNLTEPELLHTHLHDWHQDHGAKMAAFAGFHMPLWYSSTIQEHLATRNAAGLFDVTHMGRIMISGPDSTNYLDFILPTRIRRLQNNMGTYSVFCTKQGGIVDDLFLFRLSEQEYYMVVNSANRSKDFAWMKQHSKDYDVQIQDISNTTPMFAVQGPKAIGILQKISSEELETVPRFGLIRTELGGHQVIATRSGYTGEDGMEIAQLNVSNNDKHKAINLWNTILDKGKSEGLTPVGLAARDTLRLEAGMVLYGNDISEETTPLQARISFIIHLKKDNFLGKDALLAEKASKPKRLRVGLIMMGKGIPRPNFKIYGKGEIIGHITSGSISPIIRKGIALGYVTRPFRKTDTLVHVEIGSRKRWAEIIHPKRLLDEIRIIAAKKGN